MVLLAASSAPVRADVDLGDGLAGGADARRGFWLTVEARRGDGWWSLTERLCGDAGEHAALRRANGSAPLHAGRRYAVPPELWPPGVGARLAAAVFPADGPTEAGWRHRVTDGRTLGRAESPWTLARLFTGDGRNHARLLLPDARPGLRPGDEVVVPWDLLAAHLRPATSEAPAAAPASPAASRTPDEGEAEDGCPVPEATAADHAVPAGTSSDDGLLTYGEDAEGPHATYRLAAGETLYTHVVLRFTPYLSGRCVNDAALRFAARSGIGDVTDIPVGFPIKIPLPELQPRHLPPGHPVRRRWEAEEAESRRLARREQRRDLEGVHVLLDVGHGGVDPGAGSARVWEDDYAYDVACRLIALLEERTLATVHPLVRDKSSGHAPQSLIRRDSDEVLLTNPALALDDPNPPGMAVNLRWLLSNDIYRRLRAEGVPDTRIVFISVHADSLHRSARGAMAYYPAARLRVPHRAIRSSSYRRIREARDANAFSMTREQMLRSEGLSRGLGESFIAAVRDAGLPVHQFNAVRGHVVRGQAWVPAVLKYNRVPTSVLLEACNLNNPEDQRNLRDPTFRQRLAGAFLDGLVRFFDSGDAQAGQ